MTDSAESRFDGKVVVVTGAGQGLGRVIAHAFARERALVVLAARSTDRLEAVAGEIEREGGRALCVATDVREAGDVERLRDIVLEQAGSVDVLVNNSGVGGPTAVLWEQSLEDWEDTFRVNVTGVFLCCKAFLPTLIERRAGSVVVIGSMTGKRPLYGRTPYAASKTALIGLVRTLAWEAGPANVRVNLISPGAIAGDRLDGVIANQAQAKGISVDEARQQFASASPLGRFVEPTDVADAALYLASDQAKAVTGEDMNVSAGAVTYG
jgi:NAD(P)-dependent dehydrogenase (short-subunit alcohol dehydrogenase family)